MKLKTVISALSITLAINAMIPITSFGQKTYSITDASTMTIYGSANVTDWEAKVKTITGEVVVSIPDGNVWDGADASWFQKVSISIPVEDIDADSRRMNNNMHDYLKESAYPNITYEMKEVMKLVVSNNPGATLMAKGEIIAAGVPFEIEHEVKIRSGNNGQLIVSGSKELLMTDFGIDPPTAMLGSIRSHDKMNITFELVLETR